LKETGVKTIAIHAPASGSAWVGGDDDHRHMARIVHTGPPDAPAQAAAADRAASAAILEAFLAAMRSCRFGEEPAPCMQLDGLRAGVRDTLNESLGQGEVSAIVLGDQGDPGWRIQETAFAGIWRVQRVRGDACEDLLEAGDLPGVIKEAARQPSAARLDATRLPPGVMNAPALVNEIRYRARCCDKARAAHVVNLSLLPLNAADLEGLSTLLGVGPVSMLSRGFGNCRIASTGVRGVWRVQYFNSMSTLILDTIEVVDLPEAARATAEDYAESVQRLEDLIAWLREG
jgi:hydrogenase-1 operon protein HyaF